MTHHQGLMVINNLVRHVGRWPTHPPEEILEWGDTPSLRQAQGKLTSANARLLQPLSQLSA